MQDDLLYMLQNDFPLAAYPFHILGKKLDVKPDTLMKQIREMKEQKIIRQISAIFDTRRLGYDSSLVAFKITGAKVESAAEIINRHPGVSHNYLRNHNYNVWFTVAVPPDSRLGLNQTVEELRHLTEAESAIVLPTLKMFKISVKLDTSGKQEKKEKLEKKDYRPIKLKARHFAAVRELQKDISITDEPFRESAERLNMSYEEFFNIIDELQKSGVMRRFAAILNHRKAGFTANAMSVWRIPENNKDEIGRKIAEYRAVSHCYLRPVYPDWPYNLFAMIHARTKEECEKIIDEIARETGIGTYEKLYSTREFKKQRIVYFDPAFEEWENNILESRSSYFSTAK